MKTNGETHSEQTKVEKILRSLTPRFEHVVAAIEEANDISTMVVRLLSGSLRAHEQQMNDNKIEKSIEQALQAQKSIGSSYHKHGSSQGRGRGCGSSYSSKGVVARIMEALSKTTLVSNVINATIMHMSADQKVIIMLPIVLKKIVITNKMKRIMQY